ncbi:MAG: T9SS type A sorting domain-containing protein [Bacteroidia bacterium]
MKKITLSICLLATSILHAQNVIQVSTFAGSGVKGNTNDTTTAASFYYPHSLCRDVVGNIYVTNSGYTDDKIRKITPNGSVSTFITSGSKLYSPSGICLDAAGNFYVVDLNQIKKITPNGVVSIFAGNGNKGSVDGNGTAASFFDPYGICIDLLGNIYVTQLQNSDVRKITPNGDVSSITNSVFDARGICFSVGNIYVADESANKIKKITPAGVVTTFAGSGLPSSIDGTGTASSFSSPRGICSDVAGNIYVSEGYSSHRIRKITPAGVVTTLAGSGGNGGSTNGIGTTASFNYPNDMCLDAAGNIYVADNNNHKIRKIQELPPAPPAVNYVHLPASVCLGSTVDETANTTGSAPQLVSNFTTLNIVNPKAICKNDSFVFVLNSADDGFGNMLDTIRKYNFAGTLISTTGLNDFKNELITADNDNNIYAVYPDNSNPAVSNIRRITPNGFSDFSFNIPSFVLDKVLAIEFGPDGYLYASESSTGYIKQIDANANVVNLPSPNPSFSFNKVVDFAFDKAGDMYLADAGLNKILKRNASNNNYYPAIPGLDTVLTNINSISIDTTSYGRFLFSSNSSTSPISLGFNYGIFYITDSTLFNTAIGVSKPKATLISKSGVSDVVWALDTVNNQVRVGTVYTYQITPELPAGLSYNYLTGAIFGKATAPSPLTTYTIDLLGTSGITSSTITFEVAPTSALTNSNGASSTIGDQKDGLTVKYFSPNNCSKMIEIADSLGGTEIGKVQVTETVSNLATFSSGKFVGRVTEINTQNPNADARLKLFFTYQDIQNYNAANGTGIDLTNDTIGKTMQVAVLQLHKDSTGHIEQIQHNPITANWVSAENNWKVEFPITKFSTFYTGEATEMSTFTCADSTQSTVNANNTYYVWYGDSLFTSGVHYTTLVNTNGCDSVLTLNLTLLTTSMSESALKAGVSVYPNPNNGVFNVKFTNSTSIEPTRLRVVNVLGTEVLHTTITGNAQIDLTKYNSGVYFVTIETNEKPLLYRIIKE